MENARQFTDALVALATHPIAVRPGEAFEVAADQHKIRFWNGVAVELDAGKWIVTSCLYDALPCEGRRYAALNVKDAFDTANYALETIERENAESEEKHAALVERSIREREGGAYVD